MGKTFKEYKGEKYNAKDRKKTKEKKYFGNTSGTHSRKTEGVAVKALPQSRDNRDVTPHQDQEHRGQQEEVRHRVASILAPQVTPPSPQGRGWYVRMCC